MFIYIVVVIYILPILCLGYYGYFFHHKLYQDPLQYKIFLYSSPITLLLVFNFFDEVVKKQFQEALKPTISIYLPDDIKIPGFRVTATIADDATLQTTYEVHINPDGTMKAPLIVPRKNLHNVFYAKLRLIAGHAVHYRNSGTSNSGDGSIFFDFEIER